MVPRLGTMPLFSPRTPQPGTMPGPGKPVAIRDFLKTDMPRNLHVNAQDLTAILAVWKPDAGLKQGIQVLSEGILGCLSIHIPL